MTRCTRVSSAPAAPGISSNGTAPNSSSAVETWSVGLIAPINLPPRRGATPRKRSAELSGRWIPYCLHRVTTTQASLRYVIRELGEAATDGPGGGCLSCAASSVDGRGKW